MPTLSLCIIAKDEEQFLLDCLSSVRGIVDEIVVCDTGSQDRTREIARRAGAILVEHPWADDFSAARNAALDASSGTHILVLDADERLMSGAKRALREALSRDWDLAMLPLHNASTLTASEEEVRSGRARRGEAVLLPRLFRRSADLRWEGVIHESPTSWLKRAPRRIIELDAHILHLGAVPELRQARGKRTRNIRLLEQRTVAEPKNPQVWAYLAGEYLHLGQLAQAQAAIEKGWQAALRLKAKVRPDLVQLITLRAHIQLGGDLEGIVATMDQARAWGVRHPNFCLLEAIALRQLPEPQPVHAIRLLEQALCWEGSLRQEPIPGARGWASQTQLAELRLSMGELDAANEAIACALLERPDLEQARLAKGELFVLQGDGAAALQAVESMLSMERPDPWVIAAAACSLLGEVGDMQALLRRAEQLQERGFVNPDRRKLMDGLLLEAALYRGQPRPGDGVVGALGALAARVPAFDDGPMVPEGAGRIALNLVRAGQPELLDSFFGPRAQAMLPGLGERVTRSLQAQGIETQDDGEPEFVFIGGAGRSGTTLFRAMLGAHPGVHCGPELKLVPTICTLREQWQRTMGADLAAAGVGEEVLDNAVRAFVSQLLVGSAPAGKRVAEKTPHNLLHMAMLGRLFPRARFVHIVRDGRAVSASLVRQRWIDPATQEPIWYCKDLEGASRYWVEVVASVRQQAAQVPGRYLELRYEDLVQDPRSAMRQVLAFLGEPWSEQVLSHEESQVVLSEREASTDAVRAPVNLRAVNRWRGQLSDVELRRMDARAEALLERLGYAV
ncbi:MAG: tetratricopeptide (TPR) repeat protein [Cognaticolwellia sp.]|jgi:tetratricopeptide (TPR) repeat protein